MKTDFAVPRLCDEVIFKNENYQIKKIWDWNIGDILRNITGNIKLGVVVGRIKNVEFEDEETGIETDENMLVFTSVDGKRVCEQTFTDVDYLTGNLLTVYRKGEGWGIMDSNFNIIEPPIYQEIETNKDIKDIIEVKKDGEWYFWSKEDGLGKKSRVINGKTYYSIGPEIEGRRMVAIEGPKRDFSDILSEHPYEYNGSLRYGLADKDGNEVIPPVYVELHDLNGDLKIAVKSNPEPYYLNYRMLVGVLDKNGNTVIPFKFWKLAETRGRDDLLVALVRGKDLVADGLIDLKGEWVLEPIYDRVMPDIKNGLVVVGNVYPRKKPNVDYDYYGRYVYGVYDIDNKKELIKPQFSDAELLDDGRILVEETNKFTQRVTKKIIDREGRECFKPSKNKLTKPRFSEIKLLDDGRIYVEETNGFTGRVNAKIIDSNGRECTKSNYTKIDTSEEPYVTKLVGKKGSIKTGLIDKNGDEILPCKYDPLPGGVSHPMLGKNRLILVKDHLYGIMDRDGNEIVPPIYDFLFHSYFNDEFYSAITTDGFYCLLDRDGKTVLPPVYDDIWVCNDNRHIIVIKDGVTQMLVKDSI